MFDRIDATETYTRATNKSQKMSTKLKRAKQRQTAHTSAQNTQSKTRQDLVEAEMEKSRKAVEHKLNCLSGTNQAAVQPRHGKRGAKGSAAAAGVSEGRAGEKGGVQRRKHIKKQELVQQHMWVDEPSYEKITKVESRKKLDKAEARMRGGYNETLESPRRNGLTPRDFAAEAELAALMAAARRSGAAGSMKKENPGDTDTHDDEQPSTTYGQLGVLPRFKCSECGARFNVRSLLGAHRRTHDNDFKVRFCGRGAKDSNTTLTNINQCKFCDRKFDLVRTLHIHQLAHCKKIPPQLRRKLGYTELAHVKKAPLPSFQRSGQGQGDHSHRSYNSYEHHGHRGHYSHRSHRHQHKDRERTVELKSHGMKHPLRLQSEEKILRSSTMSERWR